jgi:hypothetical protein
MSEVVTGCRIKLCTEELMTPAVPDIKVFESRRRMRWVGLGI